MTTSLMLGIGLGLGLEGNSGAIIVSLDLFPNGFLTIRVKKGGCEEMLSLD